MSSPLRLAIAAAGLAAVIVGAVLLSRTPTDEAPKPTPVARPAPANEPPTPPEQGDLPRMIGPGAGDPDFHFEPGEDPKAYIQGKMEEAGQHLLESLDEQAELTDEQIDRLTDILEDEREATLAAMHANRPDPDGPRPDPRVLKEQTTVIREHADEAARELLNEAQFAVWQRMHVPPEEAQRQGRGPGGRPMGGGPGGPMGGPEGGPEGDPEGGRVGEPDEEPEP